MQNATIFDKTRQRAQRNKYASKIADYNFLIDHAARSIIDRLSVITLKFDKVAIYGGRTPAKTLQKIISALNAKTVFLCDYAENLCYDMARTLPDTNILVVQSDAEWLPFANHSLDACIGIFEHHSLNDLPGALVQAQRALRPDGLFLAAMPGADTLYEMREAMQRAELDLYGGMSPHIFPFADKQQYGALMQRAGFALPVVDSEHLQVSYTNIFKLFHDLKSMGEGNYLTARNKKNLSRQFFDTCEKIYRTENGFTDESRFDVTFEIIHLIGWAPDKTKQQQPLKPGSAETSLTAILSSDE